MSNIDDLKADPNQAASELMHPDQGSDGEASIGSVPDPSARADGSSTTGIPHGVIPDDLAQSTIETLGQYLGVWTDKNITKVDPTPRTATPTVDPNQRSGQTYHAIQDSKFFSPGAYNWDDSEKLTPTAQYLDGDHTANTMLRDVPTAVAPGSGAPLNATTDINAGGGIPAQVVSHVLKNNRFMQGKPFYTGGNPSDATSTYMLTSRGAGIGDGNGTVGVYSKDAKGVSVEALTHMAERLLAQAAGEGDRTDSLSAILPSWQQTTPGISKIDVSSLSVMTQLNDASAALGTTEVPISDVGVALPADNRQSYGVLNHPAEVFGGLPAGMIVVATITAIALAIASLVVAFLMDVLLGWWAAPKKKSPGNPAALGKGRAFGSADYGNATKGELIWRWMGLPDLQAEYDTFFRLTVACFTGLGVFWIPQLFFSPGYYAVVHRNAIRDVEQIARAGKALGSGEVDPLNGLFLVVDSFTTSATYRLMTTIVKLGDLVRKKGGPGDNTVNYSSPRFATKFTIGSAHSMQRIEGTNKQALSNNVLPMQLIAPYSPGMDVSGDGTTRLGRADFLNTVLGWQADGAAISAIATENELDPNTTLQSLENGRFSTAMREQMEEQLDAYYVPFYFHDMRTNEVVPFHCFVENISDSFAPEYTQVKGFGRLDPVQIYKGTTRKIGMSFWVVASSVADYDAMWLRINKLVSMVYPQWSKGDIRVTETGGKFTMPFSQVMKSSPLIRIRLGELFSSNIAVDSVRRLFGAGNPELFEISADPGTPEEGSALYKEAIAETNKAEKAGRFGDGFPDPLNIGLTVIANPGKSILDAFIPFNWVEKAYPPGTVITLDYDILGDHATCVTTWGHMAWLGHPYGSTTFFGAPALTANLVGLKVQVVNYWTIPFMDESAADNRDGGIPPNKREYYYICAPYGDWDMSIAESHMAKAGSNFANGPDSWFIKIPMTHGNMDKSATIKYFADELAAEAEVKWAAEFFNPASNAIVRGFSESGGQGLAGVITALDFDWNAAPWEISSDLGRGPQYCKVTLGFNPIHDIPPGLAADGSQRASVYPIGKTTELLHGDRHSLPGDISMKDRIKALRQEVASQIEPASGGEAEEEGLPT